MAENRGSGADDVYQPTGTDGERLSAGFPQSPMRSIWRSLFVASRAATL